MLERSVDETENSPVTIMYKTSILTAKTMSFKTITANKFFIYLFQRGRFKISTRTEKPPPQKMRRCFIFANGDSSPALVLTEELIDRENRGHQGNGCRTRTG